MQSKKHPAIVALVVIVLIGLATGAIVVANANKDDQGSSSVSSNPATSTSTTAQNSSTSTTTIQYKDGTYTQKGDYITPGGRESITLTVTLKDGVVTDSSIENVANNRDSREYQAEFADNYKSKVVGKPVAEISLSRVAGSSLTSNGFNDALEQIRNSAKI